MMYGSKDLNLTFKQAKEESDLFQQQKISSGLLRYRSAPSTLLGDLCEEFLPHREPEPVFGRFMAEKQPVAVSNAQRSAQFMPTVDEEAVEVSNSATLQMLFQSPQQPQQIQGFGAETGYPNSMGMGTGEGKVGVGGGGSSLLRQSSSPAGFLTQLNSENGFSMMRGMGGGFRQGGGTNAESGAGTSGKFKGQLSFPSRQGSRLMSQISEIGSDGVGRSSPEDAGIGTNNGGYQVASWEDSVLLSDSFADSKKTRDHSENGELRGHVSTLTHHLSLPANVSEMASMEKFLQFQDSVPCKIRAKRGCATHPRSIAERMRRTRISERMRKLQDLVPNMDKQTNTADMLDLAVEYIKDLQKKVKRLGDDRVGCTCSAKHKP